MSPGDPAVLVMAPPSVVPEPVAGLGAALEAEADRWASEVAPGHVHHANGSPAEATARVLAAHAGPLLVVWPVLARLRPEHAAGALGDLRDGVELVIGPVIDGGLYLLGLGRPLTELMDLPGEAWSGADAMSAALAAAAEAGHEVGILRAERALRSEADVRAALADPLTPEAVRAMLLGR
jgi:hypothetical protein